MLRVRTLGASLIALVGSAGLAGAADLNNTYEPPAAPAPVYSPTPSWSWTGPYAGLQGGYAWSSATITSTPAATMNGWQGGVYGGYNFQMPNNIVVGVEGDVGATSKSGTSGGVTVKNPWDATLRGRVGYAFDRFMVYGTGGLAVGGVSAASAGTTETQTRVGWVIGGGVEASLTDNVTARVEFRHIDLGSGTYSTLTGSPKVATTSNDVLFGVGLKF